MAEQTTGKLSFAPSNKGALGEEINRLIDDALVAHRKAEYEKGRGSGSGDVAVKRIGAGYIGTECSRELAYRYHKAPKEERDSVVGPGELQRHAEAGHWTEAETAVWLRWAGFEILTHQRDNADKQIGFGAARDPESGKYRIAGEVDGVILASPPSVELPEPCIWESKKATDKKWKKFSKQGVKKADPKYYGQLQINMAYLCVEHTLFSMLNLDNMKYYWELVPFDQEFAQKISDRAAEVLASNSPEELPRITSDQSDFRCKFCDYQNRCWSTPEISNPTTITPPPSWITAGNK